MLGFVFFAFQIYGDFSGYSDIAIGTSRLFGFNLMKNFAFPYFSRDITEFWRCWHISLSTWFRDYVYIPLGGSRGGIRLKIRNTFIIFVLSAFWHGANWTFIAWGTLNVIYFLPFIFFNKNRKHTGIVAEGRLFPNFKEMILILSTFFLTLIAWVFFRAESIYEALQYIGGIFSISLLSLPEIVPKQIILFIAVFVLIEWIQRTKQHALQFEKIAFPKAIRWGIYYTIIMVTLSFGGHQQKFIYFQF